MLDEQQFPSLGTAAEKEPQKENTGGRRWQVRPSQERLRRAREAARQPKPPTRPQNAWGIVPGAQKVVPLDEIQREAAETRFCGLPARPYNRTTHQWNTGGVRAPDASFQEILDEEYARRLAAKYAAGIFDD